MAACTTSSLSAVRSMGHICKYTVLIVLVQSYGLSLTHTEAKGTKVRGHGFLYLFKTRIVQNPISELDCLVWGFNSIMDFKAEDFRVKRQD